MKRLFTLLLIIIASFTCLNAQQAGFFLTMGFPTGEFKDNLDRIGVGIEGEALFFRTGPAQMGIHFGYLNYGSETRRERFSTTIPDVFVDVDRTNNIVNFHLLFNIAPSFGPVTPYAEGLFGGSYIFTETKIDSWDDEVASTTNFDDWAWSYGAGAGVLIHLFSNPFEGSAELLLDLKVRYLYGTEAEYLKEGSVRLVNGYAYYDVEKSKTDMITASLGVTIRLNSFLF